jgi:hypothetical protein
MSILKRTIQFVRGIFAAFALGAPTFTDKQVGQTDSKPIEHQINRNFALGGSIETRQHRQQNEYTIAGGPGSQKIGNTFAALPEEVRQAFLDIRKNINVASNTAIVDAHLAKARRARQLQIGTSGMATESISRGLQGRVEERYRITPDGLKPREEFKHDAEAYANRGVDKGVSKTTEQAVADAKKTAEKSNG